MFRIRWYGYEPLGGLGGSQRLGGVGHLESVREHQFSQCCETNGEVLDTISCKNQHIYKIIYFGIDIFRIVE